MEKKLVVLATVKLQVEIVLPSSVDSYEVIKALRVGVLPTELFAKFEGTEEILDYDTQEYIPSPVEVILNNELIYTHIPDAYTPDKEKTN